MIEVKNLVKYYGNHPAVDDISFSLEKGKVYGFLGPNGAGKSTTMNIMTGYLAATSGDVIINDHDIISDPEEAKRSIGYLPEQPPLYMDMTVHEYLLFAAELKKIKRDSRKVAVMNVMEMTGLLEYKDRLIANLSKGYRQRVGLAQAILADPEIIILDEPTVGLDPRQIIEIRDLIRKLSVGHTIILSSHILTEISVVCDHILMIVRGHLIANDTPKNLVEKYAGDLKIEMKVIGAIDEVRDVLERIDGIKELTVTADMTDRSAVKVVLTEKEDDIRIALFNAFAAAELPVIEMKRNEPSLEDVFLRLSAEEEARVSAKREAMELEKMNKKNAVKEEKSNDSDL